jgi:N,N'-diacetyllegionaminate synthase
MKNKFSLSNKIVAQSSQCYLIAEIAQSHDGSLGMAHAFIDAVAETGFDAIKFQTHIASAESTLDESFRVNFSYEDRSRFDYWKRMEFSLEQWAGLKKHADEKGLFFLSSVFSLEAVELLSKIGIGAWKVGSGELSNTQLLLALAETGKPVMLSTGMSGWSEIENAASQILDKNGELAIFQCTSAYPTSFDSIGLNVITELIERYSCPIGLSDHSGTIFPSILAMARGASLIEVHATFHKNMFGPDVPASLTMEELKILQQAREAIYSMDSNPVDKNKMADQLTDMRLLFNKSVALVETQCAGTTLTRGMLTTKKPGTGIPARDLDLCLGKVLVNDTHSDRLLSMDDFHGELR